MTKLSSLVGKIHNRLVQPQVPLNAKESQKLLKALNSEFHKELDKKHPRPIDQHIVSPSNIPPATSPYDAATHHLDSILSSPALSWHQSFSGEPFKKRIGPLRKYEGTRGTATLQSAKDFLGATLKCVGEQFGRQSLTHDTPTPLTKREVLRKHGAGWQVMEWLKASGLENPFTKVNQLEDSTFIYWLMLALIAEGRGEIIMECLKTRLTRSNDPVVDCKHLVGSYVKAHKLLAFDQQAIVNAYNDCWEQCSTRPENLSAIFANTRAFVLSQILTKNHGVSGPAYDKLVNSISWEDSWALQAMINLYHPTNPKATLLLFLLRQDVPLNFNSYQLQRGVNLDIAYVAAGELLISQKDQKNAQWLLEKVGKRALEIDKVPSVLDILEDMEGSGSTKSIMTSRKISIEQNRGFRNVFLGPSD